MALRDRLRLRKQSTSTTSNSSAASETFSSADSNSNSGSSSPTTTLSMSRAASTEALSHFPNLTIAPTAPVSSYANTPLTSAPSQTLTKSSTSSSLLSRFRSSSSSKSEKPKKAKKENWAKYAPKKYKFATPCPERTATLSAWEFSWQEEGGRWGSISSGISPSRNPSMDIPRSRHVEDVAVGV